MLLAACGATRSSASPEVPQGTPLAVSLRTRPDAVEVYTAGELFATVRFGDDTGPCVFPLNAAHGTPVTRGFPMEPGPDDERDHPHHRSLWFAHGDVDGVDFWHGGGRIETLGFEVSLPSKSVAIVELSLAWRAQNGRELLREKRRYTFHAEQGLRWVDASHRLQPADEGVVFGDTKEGTFALRVAPTLRSDGPVAAGRLVDADGRVDGDVWGKRSTWIAATGPVADSSGVRRDVTVALMEHPSNFRFPTWWHARTYGLLAANPFGKGAFEGRAIEGDGSFALSRGETLWLRYRVLLGDDALSAERIEVEAKRYSGDETDASLI
ncbi:MAG: PmoA family protein [Planctomycetota bacterium]